MKFLYLIPARAGSKGVPGKNIRPLGGKPLISHSIHAALQVASPGDVVVSTDSPEIAGIARSAGARTPFLRPAHLAADSSSSRDVMLHALDFFKSEEGRDYEAVVLLQPTSPFRNPDDIRKSTSLFEARRPDMVVSVKKAASNPYYNAFEPDSKGYLHISKGDGRLTRRQDAPPVWEFDGSIYVIDAGSLRQFPSLALMPEILPLENSSPFNIDIDTELDFMVAEAICSRIKS